MTKLQWDVVGERRYETGVDHGVLYLRDAFGSYNNGFAWNGLTTVTESPSGAEATPMYADNIKYLNLVSAEEFGATIEAYTYPDEFAICDGTASPTPGITVGQQARKTFGLSYRTRVGNDIDGTDAGYKLHLIYGALAAPTEKAYGTINDSPEAIAFSWSLSTTAIEVPGFKPSATVILDSTKLSAAALTAFETVLYGSAGSDPRLPTPEEVFAFFTGTVTTVTPTKPTQAGNVVTIPVVAGAVYKINGVVKTGAVTITKNEIVRVEPVTGYKFPDDFDSDWSYTFS